VTATGTFRMQASGPGGTVDYTWIYKDTDINGNTVVTTHTGTVVVAAGDTAAHSLTDTYGPPNSAGTAQLVFTSPSYTTAQQSWSCRQ
jgi:hypothetical protein